MGDDRDGGEDDADLEADLGELVEEVLVVVVGDVHFVVVHLLDQGVVGGDEFLLDPALMGDRGGRRFGLVVGAVGEDLQHLRVAFGDVDLQPVALQPRGDVGAIGLV